ncbi:MAG: hypothetical protein JXB49_13445 [Bacteroidales bacterium]|nr:hypothetical protein [Bacteroidales bacterium]
MKKSILILYVMLFAAVFVACDEDDDDDKKDNGPAYVGIWVYEYYSDAYQMDQKQTLTLTETTFQVIVSGNQGGTWIDLQGFKGTMVVDGEDAVITLTHAGAAGPSGSIIWEDVTTSSTAQYLLAMALSGQTTVKAKVSVEGNLLSLILDEDGDSDLTDEDTSVYTKQ